MNYCRYDNPYTVQFLSSLLSLSSSLTTSSNSLLSSETYLLPPPDDEDPSLPSSDSSSPMLPFTACASAANNNDATILPPRCKNGTQTSSAPLTYREDLTTTASVSSIRAFAPPRTTDLPHDDD